MDKLIKYRQKIKKVLTEYHDWVSGSANLEQESCLVFDETHDRDFWFFIGWEDKKKIRNIQVHIRIKNLMLRKMNIVMSKISIKSINTTGGLTPQTPIGEGMPSPNSFVCADK